MLGPAEINNRFGYHKANEKTGPQHDALRKAYRQFAEALDEALPDGRAKNVAFTELENASMWSHKAIAEQTPPVPG